jgi:A/G-specific adenine glycosylase
LLGFCQKRVCSFGFRIDAKRQSCYFNQAIMEFGALQCVPKVQIVVCVFNDSCAALQKKVDQLPVKSKKLKVRNRYFNYLVVSDENENTIQKREPLKEFGKFI